MMRHLQTRLEGMLRRTRTLEEDIDDLRKEVKEDGDQQQEGTIAARLEEAAHTISRAKDKIQNANDLVPDE